jgi:inosine-uridine nucleoside N-ribohydrolase
MGPEAAGRSATVDLFFDMETRDPDDALALCVLATHPRARLRAVTLNPGTPAQVAVVRTLLRRLGCERIPVGARNPGSTSQAVSPFHERWLGPLIGEAPDAVGHQLLADAFRLWPGATLLTGAPLHNLRLLLRNHPEVHITRWVAQGGFAGAELIPVERQLPKFAGRTRCESYNFGGDKPGTLLALASSHIQARFLVSKDVTHGVAWNAELHRRLGATGDLPPGVALMSEAMEIYLREHEQPKLLHDVVAACAALDSSIVEWAEVEVRYQAGQWGAVPAAGSGTWISVGLDHERLLATMCAPAALAPPR